MTKKNTTTKPMTVTEAAKVLDEVDAAKAGVLTTAQFRALDTDEKKVHAINDACCDLIERGVQQDMRGHLLFHITMLCARYSAARQSARGHAEYAAHEAARAMQYLDSGWNPTSNINEHNAIEYKIAVLAAEQYSAEIINLAYIAGLYT